MDAHIVFTVRKQRKMGAGAQLNFSFLSSAGLQPREWCLPHLEVGLLSAKLI